MTAFSLSAVNCVRNRNWQQLVGRADCGMLDYLVEKHYSGL
jgi:hypothetical protein